MLCKIVFPTASSIGQHKPNPGHRFFAGICVDVLNRIIEILPELLYLFRSINLQARIFHRHFSKPSINLLKLFYAHAIHQLFTYSIQSLLESINAILFQYCFHSLNGDFQLCTIPFNFDRVQDLQQLIRDLNALPIEAVQYCLSCNIQAKAAVSRCVGRLASSFACKLLQVLRQAFQLIVLSRRPTGGLVELLRSREDLGGKINEGYDVACKPNCCKRVHRRRLLVPEITQGCRLRRRYVQRRCEGFKIHMFSPSHVGGCAASTDLLGVMQGALN